MSSSEPKDLVQSPEDAESRSFFLQKMLMNEIVVDAAYGSFMRIANPFSDPPPLANPPNLTGSLPEGITITSKELGIINLTAQFMAVFGVIFQRALFKMVTTDPLFDFMTKPLVDNISFYPRLWLGYRPTDNSKQSFYCRLFLAYMSVLKPCELLTAGASPQSVVDAFFKLLALMDKQEDEGGVEKIDMFDLHVLESLVRETRDGGMPFPSGYLSMMQEPFMSQINADMPDDKIGLVFDEIREAERSYSRSSVSYHAAYQQKLVLSQDHGIFQHPEDLQNNSDQAPVDPTSTSLGKRARDLDDDDDDVNDLLFRNSSVRRKLTTNEDGARFTNLERPPFIFAPPLSMFPSLSSMFQFKLTTIIPEGITRKELGIIKLTAQFAAVYGVYFQENLEKSVIVDPRFDFLKSNSSRYPFFSRLSNGYSLVLLPSPKLSKSKSCAESADTVLKGFWHLVEKLEEGVDMFKINLDAIEFFVNTENQELRLPPAYVAMMMNPMVPQTALVKGPLPKGLPFPLLRMRMRRPTMPGMPFFPPSMPRPEGPAAGPGFYKPYDYE